MQTTFNTFTLKSCCQKLVLWFFSSIFTLFKDTCSHEENSQVLLDEKMTAMLYSLIDAAKLPKKNSMKEQQYRTLNIVQEHRLDLPLRRSRGGRFEIEKTCTREGQQPPFGSWGKKTSVRPRTSKRFALSISRRTRTFGIQGWFSAAVQTSMKANKNVSRCVRKTRMNPSKLEAFLFPSHFKIISQILEDEDTRLH